MAINCTCLLSVVGFVDDLAGGTLVGTWARRGFLRLSRSRVEMHSAGRLLVQRSCLLASRVSPYVAGENVGVVTM